MGQVLQSLRPPYKTVMNVDAPNLRFRTEHAIRAHVAPTLELDGSVIEVIEVDRGCAQVRLNGACAGCPATITFLVRAMEEELRKHVPEVEYIEAVP